MSGNTSNRPRPRTPARSVRVARRYASLAATMVNGSSGVSTRKRPGTDSNRALKSGTGGYDRGSGIDTLTIWAVGRHRSTFGSKTHCLTAG